MGESLPMKKIFNFLLFGFFSCAITAQAAQNINCNQLIMEPVVGDGVTMNTTFNGKKYEIKNKNGYVTHKENGKLKYTYNISSDLETKTNCKKY